jgi:nucleotide-binding universal stress UspA family protein
LANAAGSFDLLVLGTSGPHHTLSGAADRILRTATVPVLVARPTGVPTSPRVLVAVDARSGAEALVAAALPWLRQLDARVEIVHVEDTIPAAWADALPVHDHDGPPAEERLLLDEAMARLSRSVHAALPVRASVARGVPHKVIRELAADHDLVIVGTHGRRGLQRLWLGSVTESVARDCPVSLLVFHL